MFFYDWTMIIVIPGLLLALYAQTKISSNNCCPPYAVKLEQQRQDKNGCKFENECSQKGYGGRNSAVIQGCKE